MPPFWLGLRLKLSQNYVGRPLAHYCSTMETLPELVEWVATPGIPKRMNTERECCGGPIAPCAGVRMVSKTVAKIAQAPEWSGHESVGGQKLDRLPPRSIADDSCCGMVYRVSRPNTTAISSVANAEQE